MATMENKDNYDDNNEEDEDYEIIDNLLIWEDGYTR